MLASASITLQASAGDRAQRVQGELVSGNYFTTLGVRAAFGRTIQPGDDRVAGGHFVCVLSHSYWRQAYGGDTTVAGRTVLLNGMPFTILGVAQPGFYGTELANGSDIFVPILMATTLQPGLRLDFRGTQWLGILARLKDGVRREQADSATRVLHHQILESEAAEWGQRMSDRARHALLATEIHVVDGAHGFGAMQERYRRLMIVLLCASGLVLLAACANLANVWIARAAGRNREIAIRLALGATPRQLMRLVMAESTLLACGGGAAGVLLAAWVKAALVAYLPAATALRPDLELTALMFAVAVSALCALGIGLLPALQASRVAPAPALKGAAAPGRAATFGSRNVLVVVQVALAVVLVTGSGLFLRTLGNLRRTDKGFAADHILVASVAPRLNGYTPERARQFVFDLVARMGSLPGVQSAAAAEIAVVSGRSTGTDIRMEGYVPAPGEKMNVRFNYVTDQYFAAMRIPLVAGRGFLPGDMHAGSKVAVINETMARHFFPGASALGKRIAWRSVKPDTEIVGIAKDTKYRSLRLASPLLVYAPLEAPFEPAIHLRTAGDPAGLAQSLRREVAALDPRLAVFDVKTLQEQVEGSIGQERMATTLSAMFGGLALFLAGLGLYGVIAFSVGRRTREIGIRMALGARREKVASLVLRQLFQLVAVGLAGGLLASAALTRFVESLLFEVKPGDPAVEAAAILATLTIAALAGALPAWRATRIDPMVALRQD